MVSQRTVQLAGAAVVATAIVVYGVRRYRKLRRSGLDVDDISVATHLGSSGKGDPSAAKGTGAEGPADRAQEAQRAKDRGNKRFQGKQYKQAIDEYTKAIELLMSEDVGSKNLAVYYGNRAQCYFLLEDYEQALSDCNTSITIDPKYVKALIRRGTVNEKLRNLEQVLRELCVWRGKNFVKAPSREWHQRAQFFCPTCALAHASWLSCAFTLCDMILTVLLCVLKSLIDFTAAGLLSQMQNETAMRGCERVVKELAAAKAQVAHHATAAALPVVLAHERPIGNAVS